mmetsp:Transcript_21417/g.29966  ORF Transcript_21417/g.29966 Transcript_21417/m.29966 type:complete len:206 (+) Transcript_21417:93-710(+)
MKRIFGSGKPAQPGVSLDEATQRMDQRVTSLDDKIRKLDAELFTYKEQMAKLKPGTSSHNTIKQKALRVLKQKKMYEQQRDQMSAQQFNMEQANFTTQSLKDTAVTISAMKQANTEIKKQFKNIKIDDVDKLQDEMMDLYDQNNEIQEALSRSYDVGEVDESELEDELASLADEMTFASVPSYLSTPASTVPAEQTASTPVALTN